MLARAVDYFRLFFMRFLTFGTEAAAREVAARMGASVMRTNHEAAQVAVEALNYAKKLGDEGGTHEKQIAELLSQATAHNFEQLQKLTNGSISLSQGLEALAANPFSPTSGSSAPTSAEIKPVEHAPTPTPETPKTPKRGRGRPPKDKAFPPSSQPTA